MAGFVPSCLLGTRGLHQNVVSTTTVSWAFRLAQYKAVESVAIPAGPATFSILRGTKEKSFCQRGNAPAAVSPLLVRTFCWDLVQ